MCVALWRCDTVDAVGVFLRLFSGCVRPAAGNDVVCSALVASRDEVERYRRELADAAALKKQHPIVFRY